MPYQRPSCAAVVFLWLDEIALGADQRVSFRKSVMSSSSFSLIYVRYSPLPTKAVSGGVTGSHQGQEFFRVQVQACATTRP